MDDLPPWLRAILDEVHAADPPLHQHGSVQEIADAVRRFLAERHPELSPEDVRAVTNRFTYDWR